MLTERGKVYFILIFSVSTNCESMAYRSFMLMGFHLEVSEKLPQG